jgi:hypothetical protein
MHSTSTHTLVPSRGPTICGCIVRAAPDAHKFWLNTSLSAKRASSAATPSGPARSRSSEYCLLPTRTRKASASAAVVGSHPNRPSRTGCCGGGTYFKGSIVTKSVLGGADTQAAIAAVNATAAVRRNRVRHLSRITFAFCRTACAAKRAEGVGQQRAVRCHGSPALEALQQRSVPTDKKRPVSSALVGAAVAIYPVAAVVFANTHFPLVQVGDVFLDDGQNLLPRQRWKLAVSCAERA